MREIKAEVVTAAVRQLCITANKVLPEDLVQCIGCALPGGAEFHGQEHSW